ncbi:MAG: PorV/PorQ family protein [Bacteroidetes bacterium]|nr:PorV/PorQ family protein [Bacteroidota bacterium]
MRYLNIKHILTAFAIISMVPMAQAGNPDRIGEAGSTHLLVNPWARSSGWAGAFTSGISGVEAMRFNVAGLATSKNNEFIFSRTNWLQGADININSIGMKFNMGDASVLGASIMSFDFGDFYRTTEDQPDGTLGSFNSNYTNIGLSYAYAFSSYTSGGVTLRMVSESIADLNATGVVLDAGIQYRSGKENRFKLGFALRNVGPSMKFGGSGLEFRAVKEGDDNATGKTVQSRSQSFELPSLLNIGVGYDFFLDDAGISKLTLAGNFMANSFGRDNIQVGAEYNYKNTLMLRAGYGYEQGINDPSVTTSVFAGPSAGATFQAEAGEAFNIGLDYSYRLTQAYNGVHSLGVKIGF